MYYKRNTGGLDVILAPRHLEKISTAHDVFKEKMIHRFIIALFRVIDFILDLYTDDIVLLNCFRLSPNSLIGFSFIPSFTKHIFAHILFLPFFQVKGWPRLRGVVINLRYSFHIKWFHFHSIYWTENNDIFCFPSLQHFGTVLLRCSIFWYV